MSRTAIERTSQGQSDDDGSPASQTDRNNKPVGAPAGPNGERKPEDAAPKKPARSRRLVVSIVLTLICVGVAGGVIYWWLENRYKVETDDAFITSHNVTVSPRVAGHVLRVFVDDNQDVKQGDPLLELDDRDFQQAVHADEAALANAKAQLSQAQAQEVSAKASVAQARADVLAVEASAAQAKSDLDRYHKVQASNPKAVSEQQVDQVESTARTTAAQAESAKEKVGVAEAQVKVSQATMVAAQAQVEKAEADLANAKLQLSYAHVVAAEDGQVTQCTVEVGNYLTQGQAVMALVPHKVWVVANYKETQLKSIRVGQPVKVHVDAYDIDLEGKVDSIQAGSGAVFSMLPPENATGNYVKVVQRVPVKIVFESLPDRRLSPGMSVEPTIDITPR